MPTNCRYWLELLSGLTPESALPDHNSDFLLLSNTAYRKIMWTLSWISLSGSTFRPFPSSLVKWEDDGMDHVNRFSTLQLLLGFVNGECSAEDWRRETVMAQGLFLPCWEAKDQGRRVLFPSRGFCETLSFPSSSSLSSLWAQDG